MCEEAILLIIGRRPSFYKQDDVIWSELSLLKSITGRARVIRCLEPEVFEDFMMTNPQVVIVLDYDNSYGGAGKFTHLNVTNFFAPSVHYVTFKIKEVSGD